MKKSVLFSLLIFFALYGCANHSNKLTEAEKGASVKRAPVSNDTSKRERITDLPISRDSLEYKLASINHGSPVEEDDVTIIRFRYLLDSLEKKTANSKQQIGDMSVKAQEVLKEKYGKEVSLLELIEQTDKAIPSNSNKDVKFEEIISLVMIVLQE